MARLTSYDNDTALHDEDLLTGSNYISIGKYNTRNFKLLDLARYFANFWIQDGSLYNFASLSQSITTNTDNISSNAQYSLNLAASFGTFDADGNLVSLSQAFANNVFSVTSSTNYATAAQFTTLEATVNNNIANITSNASDITTVTASTTQNTTDITTNTGNISTVTTTANANATAISTLQTDLQTANTSITQNATNITTLDSSVTTINTTITGIEGDITSNTTNITANASDITTLTNNLVTTNANVTQNASDVTSLTTTVSTNTTNISNNGTNITSNTTNIATNASDITTLTNNLATANTNITQNASDVTSLTSTVSTNTTDIATAESNITTNTTNISTNASDISTLQNDLNTAEADIVQNATNHTSLTSTVNSNTTSINTNAGNITTNQTNISTNASDISTLTNNLNTANANISQNASDVTSLTSTVNSNSSSIGTNTTNISTNASNISTLTNDLNTAEADITQNASNVTSLTSTVNSNTSSIGTNTTNISTNASNISTLTNDLNTAEADIVSNSSDITSLTTTVNGNTGDISTNASSISTLNAGLTTANNNISANASDITTVTATANTNTGNISTNASSISSLTTTVNGNTTSISTNATSIDGIEGKYGVTIDSNDAITGFELNGGGGTSSFIINANDFKIYNSAGNLNPFSVSSNKVQINGDLSVSGTPLVQGSVSSGDFIAAKFKNTDSTNNSSVGIALNSYGDYHHRILMSGGNTTVLPGSGGSSQFDLNARFYLGLDNSYSKLRMKLNGSGIVIPNQSANGVTPSANYNGGMNIIFNDNDGARTSSSGRLHVNEYYKTFFLDVPGINGSSGTYQSSAFVMRRFDGSNEIDLLNINNDNSITFKGELKAQSGYNMEFFTNGGQRMTIETGGQVGINNNSPSATLHLTALASNGVPFKLQGHSSTSVEQMLIYTSQTASSSWYNIVTQASAGTTAVFRGDGNWYNVNNVYAQWSDESLKENIVPATNKLEEIKQLQVKNFNFIGDDLKQIGLIAQDVEQIFPALVDEAIRPGDETATKTVKYSVLVPILIKAIQELEARVAQLETP